MHIIVTGSLGNVSRPLTEMLVQAGHRVTVISSDLGKAAQIAQLGATPAIGSLTDGAFLRQTLTGADALYAMTPFSFTAPDQAAYLPDLATSYVQAIRATGLQRVVVLSGWAADLVPAASVEDVFALLPGVAVTFLRPAYFYSNFYQSIAAIKQTGQLASVYGGDDRIVLVAPQDVAAAAAEELVSAAPSPVRYVGSEDMSCTDAAHIIGAAIGQPALRWAVIPAAQVLAEYTGAGMPATLAHLLVDMQATMHDGTVLASFQRANPTLGNVKLADFAQKFAAAYQAR